MASADPKSLKQNQFGGSIGGPILRNRAFFFGSYEGYRLDAVKNFVEAVPSAAAWATAVPAIAALRSGFTAPGAVVIPGAFTNPLFDIVQLQDTQNVDENAYSARLDYKVNDRLSLYTVGSQGRNLFLRSIANRTIGVQTNGASAGTQVREFDILTCANGQVLTGSICPGSSIASIQRPYAEIATRRAAAMTPTTPCSCRSRGGRQTVWC